jgi:hypothetical protein
LAFAVPLAVLDFDALLPSSVTAVFLLCVGRRLALLSLRPLHAQQSLPIVVRTRRAICQRRRSAAAFAFQNP